MSTSESFPAIFGFFIMVLFNVKRRKREGRGKGGGVGWGVGRRGGVKVAVETKWMKVKVRIL